ncbi:unnamed protein product [Ostreobium quekettii]|uniref:Uncharacterized protein n=1 Tax=Ostreobium quekettii TaxID=121088 RepID=A0A8S1IZK0_9CHLO|nr:unnamed protein product [Ostreobium quekettii]|eukprot:evm.model.scf_600EXC.5 EVM.evm.TU.scf_600EXC.5   scf_600EXC:45323-47305(-)
MIDWKDVAVDVGQDAAGNAFAVTAGGLVLAFGGDRLHRVRHLRRGELESFPRARTILPEPPVGFRVQGISVGPAGGLAVLFGAQGDRPWLGVLDMRGGRRARDARSGRPVEVCRFAPCSKGCIVGRAGVEVAQVAWFPGASDAAFAALGSNNKWAVYDAAKPTSPGEVHDLEMAREGPFGVRTSGRCVAFALGPVQGDPWAWCSAFFLRQDGAVFAMCPVAAPGQAISSPHRRRLASSAAEIGELDARIGKWVKEAIPPADGPSRAARLPGWWRGFPALQGPMNEGEASIASEPGVGEASGIWAHSADGAVVVVTSTCGGVIFAHLLVGDLRPVLGGTGRSSGMAPCPQVEPEGGIHLRLLDAVVVRDGPVERTRLVAEGRHARKVALVSASRVDLVVLPWMLELGRLLMEEGRWPDGELPMLMPPEMLRVRGDALGGPPILGCLSCGVGLLVAGVSGRTLVCAAASPLDSHPIDDVLLESEMGTLPGMRSGRSSASSGRQERLANPQRASVTPSSETGAMPENVIEEIEKGVQACQGAGERVQALQDVGWAKMSNLEDRLGLLEAFLSVVAAQPPRKDQALLKEIQTHRGACGQLEKKLTSIMDVIESCNGSPLVRQLEGANLSEMCWSEQRSAKLCIKENSEIVKKLADRLSRFQAMV